MYLQSRHSRCLSYAFLTIITCRLNSAITYLKAQPHITAFVFLHVIFYWHFNEGGSPYDIFLKPPTSSPKQLYLLIPRTVLYCTSNLIRSLYQDLLLSKYHLFAVFISNVLTCLKHHRTLKIMKIVLHYIHVECNRYLKNQNAFYCVFDFSISYWYSSMVTHENRL